MSEYRSAAEDFLAKYIDLETGELPPPKTHFYDFSKYYQKTRTQELLAVQRTAKLRFVG